MPGTPTSRLGLPTISGTTDNVNTYPSVNLSQMQTLDQAAIDRTGTLAARPAANSVVAGTFYFATDTAVLYRSDGANWNGVASLTAGGVLPLSQLSGITNAQLTAGLARWVPIVVSGNTTIADGQFILVNAAGVTITLPSAGVAGAQVAIENGSGTGASPTTVVSSSANIYGVGANGVSSFVLGTTRATVVLVSDGVGDWIITAGQLDTGWKTWPSNTAGVTSSASVAQVGNQVRAKGFFTNSTGGTITATNITGALPSGVAVPSGVSYFQSYTGSGFITVYVDTGGLLQIPGTWPNGQTLYLSMVKWETT